MARIRSVHAGLWTDEAFVAVSALARLLFIGILNESDDWGSFEWAPMKLKMRILPADSVDVAELLAELLGAGRILRYEVDGKTYGAVRNFCQYQRPKKPNSVHPQTDEVRKWVNVKARSARNGSEPVEDEFGTGGEIARQMKDEGDSKKKGRFKSRQAVKAQRRAPRRPRLSKLQIENLIRFHETQGDQHHVAQLQAELDSRRKNGKPVDDWSRPLSASAVPPLMSPQTAGDQEGGGLPQ